MDSGSERVGRRGVLAAMGGLGLASAGGQWALQATAESATQWPMLGGSAGQTNANLAFEGFSTPPTVDWEYVATEKLYGQVVVFDETVYVVAEDRFLYALDAKTGDERWHANVDSGFVGTPAVSESGVFVRGRTRHVYRLDPGSGDVVWRSRLDTRLDRNRSYWPFVSPVVAAGRLYLSSDTALYALDAQDGSRRWVRTLTESELGTLTVPAVGSGMVLTADWRGSYVSDRETAVGVTAFDVESGARLWSTAPDADRTTIPRVVGTPAVTEDAVYLVAESDHLYRLDPTTGEEVWRLVLAFRRAVVDVTVGEAVGFVYTDRSLLCFDIESGDIVWYETTDDYLGDQSFVVGNSMLYVPSGGNIRAFSVEQGESEWSLSVGDGPETRIAAAGTTLYVGSGDSVYAVRATDRSDGTTTRSNEPIDGRLVTLGAAAAVGLANAYASLRNR